MIFADATGFFSLISLIVQCGLAWIFAVFLGVLTHGRAAWLYSVFVAFVGLGIGLTALSVRFTLAHHAFAGEVTLREGDAIVRSFYGLYLGGKAMFLWGLLRGVARWRGGRRRMAAVLPGAVIAVAFVVGFALPTIESVLLVQAPFVAAAAFTCARWLRARDGEPCELGQQTVRVVMYAMAALWVLYAAAALLSGPLAPRRVPPLGWILRVNSLIDLALQVVLASGLIVAVMAEAQRRMRAVQDERDRLRQQVERDEKLRVTATLVSGVAHEINNPLTAILGFAEDLQSSDQGVRARAAEVVREQAERCRGIVQRMSVLGRRRAVMARELDVGDVLARVVRGLRPQIESSGASIQLAVDAGMRLHADETGFEQVVTNLLTNALHVTPSGGRVRVTAVARPDAMELAVSDEGPGVREADRERIFEPFWTTKHAARGSGLGLAVVDAIVHTHGGTVEVVAAPGGGARFSVLWPWRPAQVGDTPTPTPTPRAGPAAAPDRAPAGARLLLIDDEQPVREVLRRHAELRGWQVVEAPSAERALELLSESDEPFAAIVCDLRMPGMSGIGLHDELERSNAAMLDRTIFLTGDLSSAEAAQFAARCRAQIASKPFVAAELFVRIGELARAQAG